MPTFNGTQYVSDNGTPIDDKALREISEELRQRWVARTDDASAAYSAGRITKSQYKTRLKRLYSDLGNFQYMLGRGGRDRMRPSDWVQLARFKFGQRRFINRFINDIDDLSPARVKQRSRLYMATATNLFHRGLTQLKRITGNKRVRWILDDDAEHCEDCPRFAALNWQRIKPWPFRIGNVLAFPRSGVTQCKMNCNCYLEYE